MLHAHSQCCQPVGGNQLPPLALRDEIYVSTCAEEEIFEQNQERK